MTEENKSLNPFGSEQSKQGMAVANSDSQKAIAEIQAAMMIARLNPRNQIQAMDKILNAFTRPSLAEAAQYQYAKGGTDIVGPSIRSAEAIAQLWGNIQFGFRELSRGRDEHGVGFSEVEAYAWDIETNTKRPVTFVVKHWRDTRSGGYPIKDERDIYELTANMAQRRVRACILAVIPGDVVEGAMNQVSVTLKSNADTSPEAMAKMADAFKEEHGVTKVQLEQRIQRRLDAIQPAQVITLKRIFQSLRDGVSVASDWFEADQDKVDESPADTSASKTEAVKNSVKKKAAEKNVDKDTGEIEEPAEDGAPVVTYAELAEAINVAKTSDDVDLVSDLISSIEDEKQQEELAAMAEAKIKELLK